MPPNTADWVAAAAAFLAVGTAILAILTVFLLRSRARREDALRWDQSQRDQLGERAGVIRHNLQAAVAYSDDLATQILSTRPLISGASNIADQVYFRLGPNVSPPGMKSALADDSSFRATVCISGWNSSPQTRALDSIRTELREAGLGMSGQLTLVTRATELYADMIDAGCSPAVFQEVLGNELVMRMFCDEHRGLKDSQMLINSLASHLQKESTSNFKNHIKLPVEYLNDFIRIAGNEFIGWNDEKLVEASAKENPSALDSSTKIDHINAILKDLRSEFHNSQIFEVMALLVACIDAFNNVRRRDGP